MIELGVRLLRFRAIFLIILRLSLLFTFGYPVENLLKPRREQRHLVSGVRCDSGVRRTYTWICPFLTSKLIGK